MRQNRTEQAEAQSSTARTILYYATAFFVSALFVWWFGCLREVPLHVPVFFSSDTFIQGIFVKPFLEGEFPSHISRLGAPFYHNAYLFPQNSTLDYAIAVVAGKLAGSVGAGVNIGWVFKSALAAVLATLSFRRLGISASVALAAGILYSVLPFTFARNVWHYNLSLYLVPVVCSLTLLVLENQFGRMSRRNRYLYFAGVLLIGLNDPYTAFFSCLLLVLAVVMGLLAGHRRDLLSLALTFLLIVIAGAANFVPTMIALRNNPKSAAFLRAQREEAPVPLFSMKGCDLFLPATFHPFPPFEQLRRHATEKNTVEGVPYLEHATLGMFGTFGLLLLLIALLRLGLRPPHSQFWTDLRLPAVITLFLILTASMYGFSSLIATFLTSSIRAYDRLVTFIAFFAFFATCRGLDYIQARVHVFKTPRRRAVWYAALAAAVTLGAYDQKGDGPLHVMANSISKVDMQTAAFLSVPVYEEAERFVAEIELTLPPAGMVFQMGSPGGYTLDPLIPYLVGHSARWSYAPHFPVDELIAWREWFAEKVDADPTWVLLAGFDGVWLDRKARDEAWLEGHVVRFARLPGAIVQESARNRYVFVDLSKPRAMLMDAMGEDTYNQARAGVLKADKGGLSADVPDAFRLTFEPITRAKTKQDAQL